MVWRQVLEIWNQPPIGSIDQILEVLHLSRETQNLGVLEFHGQMN
jgi:hypothetical protein